MNGETIADNLNKLSDRELYPLLRYMRDEDGQPVVSVVQARHLIREAMRKVKEERKNAEM